MVWLGRVIALTIGFASAMGASLGLGILYRGIWMPFALTLAIATVFIGHGRTGLASRWYIATLGLGSTGLWMVNTDQSPVRILQTAANALCPIVLVMTAVSLAMFRYLNRQQLDRLPWVPSTVLLVATWLIVYFSGGKGGPESMRWFFLDWFELSPAATEAIVVSIRKTIHFLFYGWVAWCGFAIGRPQVSLASAARFGFLTALSLALFDEFRQSMADNRTASLWDIGLDMAGAATFIVISVLRYRQGLTRAKT